MEENNEQKNIFPVNDTTQENLPPVEDKEEMKDMEDMEEMKDNKDIEDINYVGANNSSTKDIDFYPLYLIVPTGYSRVISVIMVLIIFGIYLILIGYMTSYQLKFVPNYYMLWDLMMGMNSKKYNDEFTRYLKTTLAYATVELQVDSFVGKKESFTPEIEPTIDTILDTTEITRPSLATQIFDFFNILTKKLSKIFNQVMLTSFVHGKKVKVSRV